MDFLDKIAPLLDQVGLHMGFSKKGDTYYLTLLPVASAEGLAEDLYSRLTPIILSGSLEELKGQTFEGGFAVLSEGVKSIANANEFLLQTKAIEEAAKTKKPEVKKSPVSVTSAKASDSGKAPVTPAVPSKPEMSKSKLNALLALCETGWNGVNKVRAEIVKWTVPDEFMAQLTASMQRNENKGKPGTQSSLL